MSTEELKIGDTVFRVTQFGARKGRSVLFTLSKLLGSAFAGAAAGDVEGALRAWSSSAKEEDFNSLCDALEGCTEVLIDPNGSGQSSVALPLKGLFDTQFMGKYDDMLLWIGFALKVNFGNFLSGKAIGGFLNQTPTAQNSPSPKE